MRTVCEILTIINCFGYIAFIQLSELRQLGVRGYIVNMVGLVYIRWQRNEGHNTGENNIRHFERPSDSVPSLSTAWLRGHRRGASRSCSSWVLDLSNILSAMPQVYRAHRAGFAYFTRPSPR